MALRLRGATSGYIELKAPASAGDNTLTLPTNNGSANQLLKTDGSGNLSWVDDNSGVSLSGSTNNTIATVTGANALAGEANFTFDGDTAAITRSANTAAGFSISNTNNSQASAIAQLELSGGDNAHARVQFECNGIYNTIRSDGNGDLKVYKGSDERLCILGTNGRIGIGTSTPGCLLNIKASGSDSDGLQLTSSSYSSYLWQIQANDNLFNGSIAGDLGIRGANGLSISTNAGTTCSLRITAAGRIGTEGATLNPACGDGGLDICSIGNTNRGAITIGANATADSTARSANTQKQYRIMMPHYADPANMVAQIFAASGASSNEINYGGGTGWAYAANVHRFYTTANTTTATGTAALTINSSQKVSINTTAETVGGAPSGQLGQLNVLSTTASGQWAIQARADNTAGNGLFVRAGNSSSYYTAYLCGYNEANVHMVVKGDGDVGIGTASPAHKLHIIDGAGTALRLGNTTNASTAGLAYNWGGSFGLKCDPDNNAGGTKHIYMQVTGTTYFNLSSTGKVTCTGVNSLTTTGGSAVYVESDGDLLRYTSSRKYKTDIETAEDKYADEILTCRPVWYRSTSTNDIKNSSKTKSDFGWFGFIAEEIAEINPRLVNYKTKESQQQSDGTLKSVELDPSAYEAESVRYTDFIPLMVNLLKRQAAKIETLETKVAALESA